VRKFTILIGGVHMENNILAKVNIRAILNNNSNAIDNIFANYQSANVSENESAEYDNLSIGQALKAAVDSIFDPTSGMTEKQKEDFVKELERKIDKGEKLTADEMQYLRATNPIEYAKMAKVQMQRQALENRLKSCKSKEEAAEAYTEAMARISDDDPAKKETMAAYNNVYEEFKKSDQYEALPATKEEAEEKKYTISIADGTEDTFIQKDNVFTESI
jgi:hypothetical protein